MSAKQAINNKLQGSVATCLRGGRIVNDLIKKGLLLSLPVKMHWLRCSATDSLQHNSESLAEFWGTEGKGGERKGRNKKWVRVIDGRNGTRPNLG